FIDGRAAWIRNQHAAVRSEHGGSVKRFALTVGARIVAWTESSVSDRYLRAGLRSTLLLYVVWAAWIAVATVIFVTLGVMALMAALWLLEKILNRSARATSKRSYPWVRRTVYRWTADRSARPLPGAPPPPPNDGIPGPWPEEWGADHPLIVRGDDVYVHRLAGDEKVGYIRESLTGKRVIYKTGLGGDQPVGYLETDMTSNPKSIRDSDGDLIGSVDSTVTGRLVIRNDEGVELGEFEEFKNGYGV
ncbi:MAG: hypothetical protein ACRD1T_18660, partial [Acidimicrobiia bacterium]